MLFRLSDVHKSYGAQDVLRGTSVQINPGEHVGLVGRNGAGKTTLFRLISGEETPDRGDVVVVIGPEGGVSAAEAGQLTAAGALQARLGPHILRASTAGALAVAAVLSRCGRWD